MVFPGRSCPPSFTGLEDGQSVNIFGWYPHMHRTGARARAWVQRNDGTADLVFDEPFRYESQVYHEQSPSIELQAGDKIISECLFSNPGAPLAFGPSTIVEECYQLVYAYPRSALPNGTFSITGATNTCVDPTPSMCAECN